MTRLPATTLGATSTPPRGQSRFRIDRTATSLLGPSIPDLVFVSVALLLVFGATRALTQSDGDLFAHIRLGESMLDSHALPRTSALGLVTDGLPMRSPAWLSEVIFAAAYRTGGLAFIAIIAAMTIAATYAVIAMTLRASGASTTWILAGTLGGIALGGTHWLARPHVFSLLGAALVIALMEQEDARKSVLLVPVFALWANFHGAWLFGLVLVGLYAAGDAWEARGRVDPEDRRRAKWHAITFVLAAIATGLNPYGFALHRDVFASLTDPVLGAAIDEYRAPAFRQVGDLLFLGAIAMTVGVLARGRTPMRAARLLVVVAAMAAALKAGRNIALFGVTGWPLVAAFASREWSGSAGRLGLFEISRRESRAVVGSWGAPAIVALLAFGILGGRVGGRTIIQGADIDASRFPVAAVARLQAAAPEAGERMFSTWDWGGFLVLAWPGARAFVDPLKFDARAVAAYGEIVAAGPAWRERLDAARIATVLAPAHGRLSAALAGDDRWPVWYRDSTAVVYRRSIFRN